MMFPFTVPGFAEVQLQLLSAAIGWIRINLKYRQSDSFPCLIIVADKAKPKY